MVTERERATVNQLVTPSTGVHSNSQHITFAKVKSYFGHLLLMVLVMEVGMIVYHPPRVAGVCQDKLCCTE